MKDLHLKRTINVVAFSSLTATVLACGGITETSAGNGDGDGDGDGPSIGPGIGPGSQGPEESFCESLRDCDPGGFRQQYGTVDECVETLEEYTEIFGADDGGDCVQAFEQFLECSADALEQSCNQYGLQEDCENQMSTFFEECGYYDYYDSY